jgi:amino acid transporter
LNCQGLAIGKWLSGLSGTIGTLLPGLVLILLGLASAFLWKRPIPTDYSLAHWLPQLDSRTNIAFLSTLMFAMAGLELTPIMAGETENPQRNFPISTAISAVLIVGTYVLGTVAITLVLDPGKVGAASGIMDAIKLVADGVGLPGVLGAVAWMITLGSFGGVSVWVVGPIKMLFESTKEGMLPAFFTELNENGAPRNAMLVQAGLISFIAIATSFLPSVNNIYQVLILMTTITYFLPYLLMFAAFLKLRESCPEVPRPYRIPGGKVFAWAIALSGLFSVVLAIVLPFFPSPDLKTGKDILLYEIEIGGGPLLFAWLGWMVYSRREKREKRAFEPAMR